MQSGSGHRVMESDWDDVAIRRDAADTGKWTGFSPKAAGGRAPSFQSSANDLALGTMGY